MVVGRVKNKIKITEKEYHLSQEQTDLKSNRETFIFQEALLLPEVITAAKEVIKF